MHDVTPCLACYGVRASMTPLPSAGRRQGTAHKAGVEAPSLMRTSRAAYAWHITAHGTEGRQAGTCGGCNAREL